MRSNLGTDTCGPWVHKSLMHMRHQRQKHGGVTLKCLIMTALQEQPLHGYGIIRAIETKHGYAPSPRAVYPTLQLLQDQGFVSMTEREDKKVYALTEEGKGYLEAHRELIDRMNARLARPAWDFVPGIGKRMGALAGTIFSNYSCLDESKINRIETVLDETRRHVGDIIFEKHTG
ncbi:MAG: PadR family transcriptional regulator [Halobacteriota archaeon]